LIKGAHKGTGLGHNFLKHVERCYLLVHLIDIASIDGRDFVQDYYDIRKELMLHNPDLAKKPGLGHNFLKHVERCYLLVHLIDIASIDGRDFVQDYYDIREELMLHNPDLAKKPEIIIANKTDVLPKSWKYG